MIKHLYNYYFPTPSYLSMNSFSIDISDQSIKYGELLATPEGIHLGSFGKEKLPEGVVISGEIIKPEILINILKKIKEKENMKFIRVSLPEERMYLFTISAPIDRKDDLRNYILLQIEDHIPLSAIDIIFDFDIIIENKNDILVQVTATSIETVNKYTNVFENAGLTPISFELEAHAISRAVIEAGNNDPIMIVDFGETKTGVSIVFNSKVYFTTTLDIGGINLTNMISKNFSIAFEKAEEMKRSYGLGGLTNVDDIFPVILNGISVLRDELTKQINFWKNYNRENQNKISQILLCGGDSNLNGLAEYLESSMKIKVSHANSWLNITNMDKSVPNMSFEESLSYTTVLGLSLAGYSYSNNKVINMLNEEEKIAYKNKYWKRFSVILLNLASVIVIIFILLLLPSYFFSESKQKIVEDNLDKLNQKININNSDNLMMHINEINTLSNRIIEKNPKYSVKKDIIDEVLDKKNQGIEISYINYSKNKDKTNNLEIRGIAKDRVVLREFKSNIEKNEKIKSSNFPISSFIEKNNISFNVSIQMK